MAAELEKLHRAFARKNALAIASEIRYMKIRHQAIGDLPEDLINGDRLQPDETLGSWLERACETRGWSQRQLAVYSKVNHGTISRIFSGERNTTLQTFSKIVNALDLDSELVSDAITQISKREENKS